MCLSAGLRVQLGNKSITTGYGLFKDDHCVATADSVNIYFEVESRKTIAIPTDIRAALEVDPTQAGRAGMSN